MKLTICFALLAVSQVAAGIFGGSSEEDGAKQQGLINTIISHKEATVNQIADSNTALSKIGEEVTKTSQLLLVLVSVCIWNASIQLLILLTKFYKRHVQRAAARLNIRQ